MAKCTCGAAAFESPSVGHWNACPANERPRLPRLQRVDSARLEEIIHVQMLRGVGTEQDVVRVVHQYWSKEGRLLAEYDSCAPTEGVVGP